MAKTTFEIYPDKKGEYRWRLVASNGEAVAVGEAYASKRGAINAATKLKEWAATTAVVEVAK